MTEREATDAEMLAAVERWAKARGFGRGQAGEWLVDTETGRVVIVHGPSRTSWTVDPHTALLWALSVEAGVTVDVGRCPACVKRSLPGRKLATTEWLKKLDLGYGTAETNTERWHRPLEAKGWTVAWGDCGQGFCWTLASRPCPDCNGSGRDRREAARLVLDAAPIDNACPHASTINGHCIDCLDTGYCQGGPETLPGDSQARDHVDVCATKLQTLGESLGLWYALWLAGKREGTADAVGHLLVAVLRHEIVNYPGQSDDRVDEWRLNRRLP